MIRTPQLCNPECRPVPRLSIVIPALNAAETLAAVLASLAEAGAAGLDHELILVDGGSTDGTAALARAHRARVLATAPSRGGQLAAGGAAARGEWLLFLHADTRLEPGWAGAADRFIADPDMRERAGVFRFALDDGSAAARRLERLVAWRTRALGLPYGDQGLLIARAFYERLGGFKSLPLMEDVDLVRRIGRRRIAVLEARAITSAARYRSCGWLRQSARNLACLALYYLGLPPRLIRYLYA
ncbi:MAG TPA: TIGR04283 family arsenosugar biosynthesis glycosyltransferase [Alphaproteobacteria bacterium]|nr:TIGR04283 family arsenosugar biosynthesis glycosyltransferase [Alphaproteobacteria bacterium]